MVVLAAGAVHVRLLLPDVAEAGALLGLGHGARGGRGSENGTAHQMLAGSGASRSTGCCGRPWAGTGLDTTR
jgi:hypothetical protein